MGTQTYAPDAKPEKIAHQSANDAKTTTPELGNYIKQYILLLNYCSIYEGQRLTGYKTYDKNTGQSDKTGKVRFIST